MPVDILNIACHGYLSQFAQHVQLIEEKDLNDINIDNNEKEKYKKIMELLSEINISYNASDRINYQKKYQKLHELAENLRFTADEITDPTLKKFHTQFFIHLFENDNKIHNEIYSAVIRPALEKETEGTSKEKISRHKTTLTTQRFSGGKWNIKNPENPINQFFSGVLGIFYHPLKKTNIPYISYIGGKNATGPKNIRFGAQVNGSENINQSFKQYLAAKNLTKPTNVDYHHVYINLQKRHVFDKKDKDRESILGRFERRREKRRSEALEALEKEKLGVAVVTLPADSHYFFRGFSRDSGTVKRGDTGDTLQNLKREIIDAIKNNTHDFYLSEEVKKKVFPNGDKDVEELFDQAVKDIVGKNRQRIHAAERQAILFHFVKFHLTDHILKKLNPSTYNVACKDNIDRGGVHNLWYETLLKKDGTVSRAEWEKNMDASSLLVKDRVMNSHRNAIWNALYQRFINNPEAMTLKFNWIADWLKDNIPTKNKEHRAEIQGEIEVIGKKVDSKIKKEIKEEASKNKGRSSLTPSFHKKTKAVKSGKQPKIPPTRTKTNKLS